jgi:hypothetical protein
MNFFNCPYVSATTSANGTQQGVLTFATFPTGIYLDSVCFLLGDAGTPGTVEVKVVALNVTAKTVTVQLWSTVNGSVPNYGVSDVSAYLTGSVLTQPAQDILNSAFARTQYQISSTTGIIEPVSGTP